MSSSPALFLRFFPPQGQDEPQGLKPANLHFSRGTTEVVPFPFVPEPGAIVAEASAGVVLMKQSPLDSVDAYDSITTVWVHGKAIDRDSLTAGANK
ncbi:MAG: hypothetical protein WB729_17675 [Candidatus Sulfotelmatobacter sp.]